MLSNVENGKVTAIADFVGGFLHGMAFDNNLPELQSCFTSSVKTGELMYSEVEAGIADIKVGGWDEDLQAALEFGLVALQIPQFLKSCKGVSVDIQALESWATIFTNPTELVSTVTKHYLLHKKAIQADIDATEADWHAGLYYKAGNDLADLLTLAVGPVQTAANMPPIDQVVPDFTAGLIYGFTGNDHKAELEGCMNDLVPIADDAQKALADIKAGHLIKGVTDLGNIIWLLPDAVSTCDQLGALMVDIDVMLAWAEQLKSPAKVVKEASKNWLFHGVAIKTDIKEEEAAWASGDYFTAGDESAEVLLGILPEEKAMFGFMQ